MPRTFNYFSYTANDGATEYSVKIADDIGDTVGLGWGAPDASNPAPTLGFRPRRVYVRHPASGRNRAVPVGTPAAYAALVNTPGSTISLFSVTEAAAQTWNVRGGREEKFRTPNLIH
jgi:hypothetical protein